MPAADTLVYDDRPPPLQPPRAPSQVQTAGSSVAHVAPEYERLIGGGGQPPTALVFLHGRRTPGGELWLVAIKPVVVRHDWSNTAGLSFYTTVSRPGQSSTVPSGDLMIGPSVRGSDPLRLYAGQPDPADDSRFTIRYQAGDTTGTIHGRLTNEPTGVRYEVRLDNAPPAR